MRLLRRCGAAILVAAALLCASPAEAQTSRRGSAPDDYDQAVQLIRAGRCDAAIPHLRRAHERLGLRNALWNLAQCYGTLSRPGLAIDAFRAYIADPRTPPEDRASAEAEIRRLEASRARISVAANIDGAVVEVDGFEAGVTPAELWVGAGRHVVVVSSPGFEPWRHELETGPGREHELEALLALLPGMLSVTTEPPGAAIFVDGEPWRGGEEGGALAGGAHLVEVRLEGYRPASRQVSIVPGRRFEIPVELEPLRGTLAVAADAADARLVVDGEERATSPFPPMSLSPGRFLVDVRAPQRAGWDGEVDVLDGRTTAVELHLPRTSGLHPAWFWSGLGGTIASVATGLALLLVGQYHARQFEGIVTDIELRRANFANLEELQVRGADHAGRATSYLTASAPVLVLAGLAAAGTVALGFLTRFSEAEAEAEIRLQEELAAGGGAGRGGR